MIATLSKRQAQEKRLEQGRAVRASWDPSVTNICEHIAPYRIQKTPQMSGRGDRRDHKILNTKPIRSVRTLAAGMMAGITSPARDWFQLTTTDPDLRKHKPVKIYLDQCQDRIAAAFARSNLYKALSSAVYVDLISAGTSVMLHEETLPGQFWFRPSIWGEYFLDINADGKVDVCQREFTQTVRQLYKKFGNACSQRVRSAWDRGDYNTPIDVVHSITPNEEYEKGRIGPEGYKFASCWWEKASDDPTMLLHESGYHEFPVMAPRWQAAPTDIYGRGPGWDELADCKELQHHELAKMNLIDMMKNPPMHGRNISKQASLVPGDLTETEGDHGLYEPAINMQALAHSLKEVREAIREKEVCIHEGFFEHLWNMLISDERNERPTATEVEARRQEVMLQLGPLLENLNSELLEPMVERAYQRMLAADQLPPPPQELEGQDVNIEFISIMHTQQQTTRLVGIRALVAEVKAIAELKGDVIDKIDADAIVEDLQQITGVRPDTIFSKEEVAAQRQERAKIEQAQQQGQAMVQGAKAMRDMSQVDVPNLSELSQKIAPVAAAQGGNLGGVRR